MRRPEARDEILDGCCLRLGRGGCASVDVATRAAADTCGAPEIVEVAVQIGSDAEAASVGCSVLPPEAVARGEGEAVAIRIGDEQEVEVEAVHQVGGPCLDAVLRQDLVDRVGERGAGQVLARVDQGLGPHGRQAVGRWQASFGRLCPAGDADHPQVSALVRRADGEGRGGVGVSGNDGAHKVLEQLLPRVVLRVECLRL
mmetsp:Transcript_10688/g.35466  ORF Transcript_10688/g.35466 Transcript_10688/m.35466 type:complete len:200 (+) Transcript_10688:657-1256(+)